MTEPERKGARYVVVGEGEDGQRIDNFLLRELKGVPRSVIYRVLRRGEVRVDGGRVKPEHRLRVGERVRVPPVRLDPERAVAAPSRSLRELIEAAVLHED